MSVENQRTRHIGGGFIEQLIRNSNNSNNTTVDATSVPAWLRWVHGRAIDNGLPGVVVLSALLSNGGWKSHCYNLDQLGLAGRHAAEQSRTLNIYYRLHLLSSHLEGTGRGTSEQSKWITHFAADVDIAGLGHFAGNLPATVGEAVGLIDASLPPSAIISSGGGLYPVWRLTQPLLLDDPQKRARARGIGRRIDQALNSHGYKVDATCHDLARVIRPPGTENRKAGRDVTVLRGWADGAGDYSIADLDARLPALPAPVVVEGKNRRNRGPSSTAAPWEQFAKRWTIEDVLAADPRHQWEQVHDQGGMRAWRYVGSSSAYSIKEGHVGYIVWSATIAAELGIETSTALDLFGLACRFAGRDPRTVARRAS
jgi:hypothetical protein